MSNAYKPVSWCGRPDVIQNFCVTFSHNFNHQYSRITNTFVIRGAPVTKETAKQVAELLFPTYTDIEITSIENDKNTLTPSEYHFIQGVLKDKLLAHRSSHHVEAKYDAYLVMLIKKMEDRMDQFPVYHT